MTLRAFHGDPAVKEKYLARVRAHQSADELIRGVGWDGARGCAIGCTLERYDHTLYPVELGLPEWLAQVEDSLFEGMSEQKSRTWPEKFLESIQEGADLEPVKGPFLIMVLESVLGSFDHAKFPAVKAAIDGSIALWRRDDVGSEEFVKVAAAADAAGAAVWDAGEGDWDAAARVAGAEAWETMTMRSATTG